MDYKAECERLKKLIEDASAAINQFMQEFYIEHENENTISIAVPFTEQLDWATLYSYRYSDPVQRNAYIALQDFYLAGLELDTAFMDSSQNAEIPPKSDNATPKS